LRKFCPLEMAERKFEMEKLVFRQITLASIKELVRLTSRFVDEEIHEKDPYFKIKGTSVHAGRIVSVSEFVDMAWTNHTFSERIVLFLEEVSDKRFIMDATLSVKYIDERDADWIAWQRFVSEDVRKFLPYHIRLPAGGAGWRLFNASGAPDMEKSLAAHGRYKLKKN